MPKKAAAPLAASPSDATPASRTQIGTPTKIGQVQVLLRREHGASLAELAAATGWQPHTIRAALSGLRKKGQVIERASLDGTTLYRIQQAR